jgi:hypothetical protein
MISFFRFTVIAGSCIDKPYQLRRILASGAEKVGCLLGNPNKTLHCRAEK